MELSRMIFESRSFVDPCLVCNTIHAAMYNRWIDILQTAYPFRTGSMRQLQLLKFTIAIIDRGRLPIIRFTRTIRRDFLDAWWRWIYNCRWILVQLWFAVWWYFESLHWLRCYSEWCARRWAVDWFSNEILEIHHNGNVRVRTEW